MGNNKVLIFSAPSGSGKTTIVNHLLGFHPEFEFSISAASRKPRGKEKNGVEYYFMSADEFRALIAKDAFVEYQEVYADHFYGTLKSEVERIWKKNHVILFDVDVQGAWNLKKYFGEKALSVLVAPPSMEELERRLRGRGTDGEEEIRMRLDKAASELEFASDKADYILVNDDLQTAFDEIDEVVAKFLGE